MKKLIAEYKKVFTPERMRSLYFALALMAIALVVQYFASRYALARETNFVGDAILDNLPVINLNPIIVEGALWMILISLGIILSRPRSIIFSLKALAFFIIIRSFFITITHTGVYPDQIVPGRGWFDQLYVALNMQTGYFFSAHTGLPFLMGLIFWYTKPLKIFFFAVSILFGISVLLAHVHYSIDVFAAPFMTFTIYKFTRYCFPEDHALTKPELA